MHVFTESLGMPLRAYVLGLRAQRAMDAMAHGRSVTEAAHIAGFADAPHLTRPLRRTVGMTAREIMHRLAERPVDRAAPGFAVIPQTRRACRRSWYACCLTLWYAYLPSRPQPSHPPL